MEVGDLKYDDIVKLVQASSGDDEYGYDREINRLDKNEKSASYHE